MLVFDFFISMPKNVLAFCCTISSCACVCVCICNVLLQLQYMCIVVFYHGVAEFSSTVTKNIALPVWISLPPSIRSHILPAFKSNVKLNNSNNNIECCDAPKNSNGSDRKDQKLHVFSFCCLLGRAAFYLNLMKISTANKYNIISILILIVGFNVIFSMGNERVRKAEGGV